VLADRSPFVEALCVTYGPYVTQNRKEGPHVSTKSALRADLDAEDRKTLAEDRKRMERPAEPSVLRRTNGDENYEAFRSRWVQYFEADFAALPAAMQTRFVTEVLNLSVPSGDISCPVSAASPPFSVHYASMMRW
jgi:hypothetical protein